MWESGPFHHVITDRPKKSHRLKSPNRLQELFLQSAKLILLMTGIGDSRLFRITAFLLIQSCKSQLKNVWICGNWTIQKVNSSNFVQLHFFLRGCSCVCWRPLWDSSVLRKDSTSRFNSPSSSSFSMTTCHPKNPLEKRFPVPSVDGWNLAFTSWGTGSFSHYL